MIKRIEVESECFEYPVFLFEYLHAYLMRFAIVQNKYKSQETLEVNLDELEDLDTMVESALRDLLNTCYEEPSHKSRSKHSSRYQKIKLDDKVYVVNYRTDPVGNTAYGVNYLLKWIRERVSKPIA